MKARQQDMHLRPAAVIDCPFKLFQLIHNECNGTHGLVTGNNIPGFDSLFECIKLIGHGLKELIQLAFGTSAQRRYYQQTDKYPV